MSLTETGIMPRPHEIAIKHDGIIRWRPEYESLRIEMTGGSSRRLIVTSYAGQVTSFELSGNQARRLADLLV